MRRHSVSLRRKAANRRNAARSTGPRTAAGKAVARMNALKHGGYARGAARTLGAFGESPEDLKALVADLVESHQPASAAERMLVEDLASLRLQRARNLRAQESLVLENLEQLELERQRRGLEAQTEACGGTSEEVREKGLLRLPDSPWKFKRVLEFLEDLAGQAERGALEGDWETALRTLYGEHYTMRGGTIFHLCGQAAGKTKEELEWMTGWEPVSLLDGEPAARGSGGEVKAEGDKGRDEALRRAGALRELRVALLEEHRDALESYELYMREQVRITPAMRGACLAPRQAEWKMLLRQAGLIERTIERKTRLLLDFERQRNGHRKAGGQGERGVRNPLGGTKPPSD